MIFIHIKWYSLIWVWFKKCDKQRSRCESAYKNISIEYWTIDSQSRNGVWKVRQQRIDYKPEWTQSNDPIDSGSEPPLESAVFVAARFGSAQSNGSNWVESLPSSIANCLEYHFAHFNPS